jgi:AcrR family transcriptional regulator
MSQTPDRISRQGRPTLEAAAALKETLLQRALELLSTRGPDGLSMEVLAEEAGVTKKTIYRHFDSKAALIDAVVLRELARLAPALAAQDGDLPPLEALRRWSWNYFRHVTDPATRRFELFLSFASLSDPETAGLLTGWGGGLRAPLLDLIVAAQAAGVLRAGDAVQVMLLLQDLLVGSSHRLQVRYPAGLITGSLSPEAFFETRWAAFLLLAAG